MRARYIGTLSTLAVAATMALGATALAADLPKEGTFSGDFFFRWYV